MSKWKKGCKHNNVVEKGKSQDVRGNESIHGAPFGGIFR
jgi:hypothetical protein